MEPISNIISFEESSSPTSSTSSKPKLTDNIFELNESGGASCPILTFILNKRQTCRIFRSL